MVFKKDLLDCTTSLVTGLTELYAGWEGAKQFDGTPERIQRMYQEFCWPPSRLEAELEQQFHVFDSGYDEMVVVGPLTVWTLCPHHLLPCKFLVTIGYIPLGGKVLGLSKFARISEIMAKRPIMQEQYCTELADKLEAKLKPKGVAVSIRGHHGCMESRGVKQEAPVTSSVLKGDFKVNGTTREEFYAIANK